MTFDLIAFIILALVAIISALGMLVSKNAVYSALFLILNFVTIALFYLLLGAPFLAMIQVTVYAGAIMVLFLFVIMLLGVEELREDRALKWQQPVAIVLGAVLFLETVYIFFASSEQSSKFITGFRALLASAGDPESAGLMLFDQYLLPFEVTSVLLLVAMVGAIVLTKKEKA